MYSPMILFGVGGSLSMVGETVRKSSGLIAKSGTVMETSLNMARSSVCRAT